MWFKPDVNGADTVHHVMKFALFQPGSFHHLQQGLLVRVHANRFDQITIAVCIAGNNLAGDRPSF